MKRPNSLLDSITSGSKPISSGIEGLELVRILEAASVSLKQNGTAIPLARPTSAGAASPSDGNAFQNKRGVEPAENTTAASPPSKVQAAAFTGSES